MGNQVLFMLLIQLGLLYLRVDAVCWIRPIPQGATTCNYHGWQYSFGSEFKSSVPYCEECTCSSGRLECCGYGRSLAGVSNIQGCVPVVDDTSCDLQFVDSTDQSKPCALWDK